jgi:AcrR family transcriptional regulator
MSEGGPSLKLGLLPEPAGPARPSVRAEQKDWTRVRFLKGALEVFEECGFQAATIERIARAAGASRATFYLHFRSKADIVRALLEQVSPEVQSRFSELDGVLDEGSDEELRQWIAEGMSWFEAHRTLVRVLEQIRMTERELGADTLIPRYTDHMPRYLARWPPHRHQEANVRLWLAVGMFARTDTLSTINGQRGGVSDETIIDTISYVWRCALQPQ